MTIKRMTFLQNLLEFVGLGGRLHLEWISSAEAQKFVRVVTEFTQHLQAMGPSPINAFTDKVRAFLGPRPLSSAQTTEPTRDPWEGIHGKDVPQSAAGGK